MDWRDLVNLQLPDHIERAVHIGGADSSSARLTQSERAIIEKAMDELWATQEGRENIINAASTSTSGKVSFMRGDPDQTSIAIRLASGESLIVVGGADARSGYLTNDGSSVRVSMQHLIFHELRHLNADQVAQREDTASDGTSPSKEREAIIATNNFMGKYYNDPPRLISGNSIVQIPETNSTSFLSTNFNPAGYVSDFKISANDATLKSPAPEIEVGLSRWEPAHGNG